MPIDNFGGLLDPPFSESRNFLDHYFASIYNKLEADALLFNRKLPHTGIVGSENELAIAEVLRTFLPQQFGIDVNALIIDRFGRASKEVDLVIFDASRPRFFRKVFPVETVYATIEVKTSLGSGEAQDALDNIKSVNSLEFRPALTPYWQTRTAKESIHHYPPTALVFAYRTNCETFETFSSWFPWSFLSEGVKLRDAAPRHPEIRTLTVCALDQGMIRMESTNGHVQRFVAVAGDDAVERAFHTRFMNSDMTVDPAKSLFLFLQRLWFDLEDHPLHPGFDSRSYLSAVLGVVVDAGGAG